jgi:septum site-determining protein MinC
MPPAAAAPQPTSFELKSAQWPVVALLLRGTDWALLQQDWAQRFGGSTEFFDHDPLLVDLSALPAEATPDLEALAVFLHAQRLRPLAYRGGSEAQRQAAERLGWACADEAQAWQAMACAPAPAAPPAVAPAPSVALATALVVDRPLRSGQQVYARGRDLIVTAMVNPGAEVVADGHIHVYAPLRGKAIAGARGDVSARIFARVLEAELVSIAGVYRTSEVPLPDEVRGKAAQIRLDSGEHGDRLLIEPLA